MSNNWPLRDIGRAETKVLLGTVDYANSEDKFNYQEFNLASNPTSQGSQELSLYPAEKWSSHFESYSPLWESVPQIDAYKLKVNQSPDAPQQTLIYGYLAKGAAGGTDFVTADDNYAPIDSAFISSPVSGTTGAATTSGTAPSFLPPVVTSGTGGLDPVQMVNSVVREIPFIPSSVDNLAADAVKYKEIIKQNGIQTHNIWHITPSFSSQMNMQYLQNWGPYWSDSSYAGATAEQAGEPGAMKVKVNANKGALMLYRVAPMNHDIGYDSRYPWVFPYIDNETGQVVHEGNGGLFDVSPNGLFRNEERKVKGKTNSPNIGFQMNIQVSAEGERGAFSDSGGGISPVVTVMWGYRSINDAFNPGADESNFAESFYVTFAHNKIPILHYHDGTRLVNIQLEDNPLEFNDNTQLTLTVEYLATSMLVRTNSGVKLISALTASDSSGLQGVWTANPNISIYVGGCTATFDFMPVYYNPWYPAGDIKLATTDIEITEQDDGVHTASNLSFNPDKPKSGFAKMVISSAFNTYANPDNAVAVLDDMFDSVWEAFQDQTYHPIHLRLAANPFGNSKYTPESGWPQCITDSRNTFDDNGNLKNVIVPIAKIYSVGSGINTGTTDGFIPEPAMKDPMSNLSIIWQVRTTHTTPLIFGFKTKDAPAIEFPASPWKDISAYVSKWEINWESEQDYKILRGSGSVTLLNPPGYIIDVVSKNRMHIQITDTGYVKYSQAVNDDVKPFLYRSSPIFTGLTVGTSLSFGPGGDVEFTINLVDPLKLLEDYRLETNLRFDSVSYFMAFAMLFQASDYSDMFLVEDFIHNSKFVNGWKQTWRGGPTIHQYPNAITWDRMTSGLYYYNSMFFGFQPLIGKSYEVQVGTQLFNGLVEIVKNMHNPASIPLFYFRPSDGMFVFQVRDGWDNADSVVRRPSIKSEIITEEQLKECLPLLSLGNNDAYVMTSDTSELTSHFTVTGSDRATGQAIKATAVNPKWYALSEYDISRVVSSDFETTDNNTQLTGNNQITGMVEHEKPISAVYGHLGYKRRFYQNVGNFVADIHGAYAYAMSKTWWLMRPVINITNLSVYGMIDYLDDGLLNIELSGLEYRKALLKQSKIVYDANEGTVISTFSVFVFPPWIM